MGYFLAGVIAGVLGTFGMSAAGLAIWLVLIKSRGWGAYYDLDGFPLGHRTDENRESSPVKH